MWTCIFWDSSRKYKGKSCVTQMDISNFNPTILFIHLEKPPTNVCVLVLIFVEPVTHYFQCDRSRTHILQSAFKKTKKKKWQKKCWLECRFTGSFFFSFFYRNRMFSRWKKKEITRTSPKAYKRCLHFLSWLNRRRVVLNSRPHCRAQVSDVNLAPIKSTKIWLYGSDSSKRSDLNVIVWSSSQF